MLKSNFDLEGEKFVECCISVFNFRKFPYFEKNQLCACLFIRKIRTLLKKNDSYLEKYKFARRFVAFKLKSGSLNFEQQ